jgi:class 3 adenylate cyclase/tetratricopeptide (TPR) repeat protein
MPTTSRQESCCLQSFGLASALVFSCPSCGHANRDGAKFCQECGAAFFAVPAQPAEQRRIVTVLFCDLSGSTTLGETIDPERFRAVLARYFERMKAIVESHGGSVEKFIGDAVMAVFGVPVAHEDDALRAVRAAAEMRDALPELGLEGRLGVMTGEVVTGTEERLATGDAVNVAARLEQAAAPGEVLLGEPTLQLVRDAVEVAAREALELKGKAEPVPAYRLRAVLDAPERPHDTPFVGRERELRLIRETWERVQAERRCELVTVVGEAGVGKSRLVAESLRSMEATVVQGRCPPYGEGITYWPVVEVLKQLDVSPSDESASRAIRSLLGETEATSSAEQIAWAFRKTLEQAGAEEPLVVVFDDIQWGEETFRDLIEHVALLSTGAPILLLCMARPELVERRSTWPVTLPLGPLVDADVDELIPQRIGSELRMRMAHAAGGNPLFITEMLAMTDELGDEVVVPPTLQALLAARLDQLEPAERTVLEYGSVEGEVFHRGAVQALSADDGQVTPRLAALVRKELIRPERPILAGDDGFRFRHLLIRDTAYDALPKATRADLHRRLASWLEQNGNALVELDEVLGYHLEQACRYRAELGLAEDSVLAGAAREHLKAGGQRAASRQDYEAAASLFERAAAFVPESEIDLELESELADVLVWMSKPEDARRRAEAMAERAAAAGDRVGELCSRIRAGVFDLDLEPEGAAARLTALLEAAVPELETIGDDMGLYIANTGVGEGAARGHPDAALAAFERAFAHAEKAGYQPSSRWSVLTWTRFAGTTPVSELLEYLDEIEPYAGHDQFFRAYKAWSLAKIGRFDEARSILEVARAEQIERGGGLLLANLTAFESVAVELLAGDPAAAVRYGEEGCRLHEELGELTFLAPAAGGLAHALYALDRLDEAEAWAARAAAPEGAPDALTQVIWRQVKAKLLARRGEFAEAERLAHEAVAIGNDTDHLDQQGSAYADLGEVLLLGGKTAEATAALEEAVRRHERKGDLVMAERARLRLDEIRGTAE